MFYEGLKDLTEHGKQQWIPNSAYRVNSTIEGLVLGGLAGGMCLLLHSRFCFCKFLMVVKVDFI